MSVDRVIGRALAMSTKILQFRPKIENSKKSEMLSIARAEQTIHKVVMDGSRMNGPLKTWQSSCS